MTSAVPAWATCAVLLLSAAAVLSASAWAWHGEAAWRHLVGLIGVAVAASWIRDMRRAPRRRLRWDGASWRLASDRLDDDGIEGEVSIAIDLGHRLLLRFVPHARRRATWIALQRRTTDGDWHALRCALHAPPAAPVHAASGALDA